MKLPNKNHGGFTLIELLVVIAIIAILASLAVPAITGALVKGQLTQTVNNAKQLQLAGMQMANDFTVQADSMLGWPGDLATRTQNPVSTVADYLKRLITYDYLKSADMVKVILAPGITPWDGISPLDGDKNCAFKVYKATDGDPGACLFAATKNFTYNQAIKADTTTQPYQAKGFVVVRKGGDAAAYKVQSSQNPSALGLLPGKTDFTDPGQESSTNILTQQ